MRKGAILAASALALVLAATGAAATITKHATTKRYTVTLVAGRHLVVRVASRATGKAVSGAKPRVTVTDATMLALSEHMHAAAMEGTAARASAVRYGTGVVLTAGHVYVVGVVVRGEKTSFRFKAV
jgi:hypothetical protein